MAAGRDDQHVLHHTTIHFPVSNPRVVGTLRQQQKSRSYLHHQQQHNKSSPSSTIMNNLHSQDTPVFQLLHPKSSQSRHPVSNRVVGSRGMRAIFLLDSGKKPSTGTGVFLPRNDSATNSLPANNLTVSSPVLLPARVVQALNLNVHELGLQFSRRELDAKNSSKPRHTDTLAENHTSTIEGSQDENVSPELLLPEEWTY
ncbi:hypothetical protein LINPERPRIM_LOCUS3853 [Linum perenne]